MVVSGSLSDGVEVKLDPGASIEDVRVGRYVTVEGDRMRFFGVVTDVSLGSTDPSLRLNPPDVSDPYIADVVSGTTAFGIVDVEPLLTLAADPGEAIDGPQPAKTVPAHFSPVSLASDRDVQIIFGTEDEGRFFIGNPLDMETRLCLDMDGLVQRSAGVFGKTGTGKTFLTRLAADRRPPERLGRQPRLRHAERVRLEGIQRGCPRGQGTQAALSLEGCRILPGREQLAAARPQARLRREDRLPGDRA